MLFLYCDCVKSSLCYILFFIMICQDPCILFESLLKTLSCNIQLHLHDSQCKLFSGVGIGRVDGKMDL